jgi:cytochrome c biogenesis factor
VVRVIFFVATIVLAIVVVVATKGSFERLGQLHFRMLWLLFVGLAIQIVLEVVDFPKDRIEDVGFAILLVSYAGILGFCFTNRAVRGMSIIAIGVALNVLVIALNQGMPTKDDVRERNGHEVHVPIEQTVKHRPLDDETKLEFLSDVITFPGFPETRFSIGDIVIALGIIDTCYEGSRVPRRRCATPVEGDPQQS